MTAGTERDLCAVVLAAGLGTRLRPLTDLRPKALCPVGNVALLDLALDRVEAVVGAGPDRVAVNAHHHADQMGAHVGARAHLSVEEPEPLGTAGAIGRLRPWIAGRDTLVVNADAWYGGTLDPLLVGRGLRLLVVGDEARGDFGDWRFAGASLLPWTAVRDLDPTPSGLYEVVWRAAYERGEIELCEADGPFVDCGTPADYLAANLAASGGESVIGPGAVVDGEVVRSVVWPGSRVEAGERLVDCIRAGPHTVAVAE